MGAPKPGPASRAPLDPELAARVLDLRALVRRLWVAADHYRATVAGPEARHLEPRHRLELGRVLATIEEQADELAAMAPPDLALVALRDTWRRGMSPDARRAFDRLLQNGQLRPGQGGGRSHRRWKDR